MKIHCIFGFISCWITWFAQCCRWKRHVSRFKVQRREANLSQLVKTLGSSGSLSDLLNRRKQHANQDADDGNHHQQFDKRKSRSFIHLGRSKKWKRLLWRARLKIPVNAISGTTEIDCRIGWRSRFFFYLFLLAASRDNQQGKRYNYQWQQ